MGRGTRIICLETGKDYANYRLATLATGVKSNSISRNIHGFAPHAGGLHFMLYEDYIKNGPPSVLVQKRPSGKPWVKVICLETKEVYDSIADAARDMCLTSSGIYRCLTDLNYATWGFHFMRYDDYLKKIESGEEVQVPEKKKRNSKSNKTVGVICIETGRKWESVKSLANELGYGHGKVWIHVNTMNKIMFGDYIENITYTIDDRHYIYKEVLEKLTDEQIKELLSLRKRNDAIPIICLNDMREFKSIRKAIETYGVKRKMIMSVLEGRRDSCDGLKWMYLDEYRKLSAEKSA